MRYQVVCAGIGGRGVLLASTILIETAIAGGYEARASDEYGMSQRGGSVVSLIKVGDFKSPLVGRESADALLAFEESEFFRNIAFLRRGAVVVVNGKEEDLRSSVRLMLTERSIGYYPVDADGTAAELGSPQASNMAVLGVFACVAGEPFSFGAVGNMIRQKKSGRLAEKNYEVFQKGYGFARNRYECKPL